MATDNPLWTRSYAASSALLATKQYFLVKRHSVVGQCVIVGAISDIPIGVLQNKPLATGDACEIIAVGKTKAQVAAATDIDIGDPLGPDGNGRLVRIITDNAGVCAVADDPATSATGDIAGVTMFPMRWIHTT